MSVNRGDSGSGVTRGEGPARTADRHTGSEVVRLRIPNEVGDIIRKKAKRDGTTSAAAMTELISRGADRWAKDQGRRR